MRQFIAKIFAILRRSEVAAGQTPIGHGVRHAVHQFRQAALPIRGTELSMEVFAGNDVRRGLRPTRGHFYVALFKNDRAFVVADRSRPRLPDDVVVGGSARILLGGKVTGKRDARAGLGGGELGLQLFHYSYWIGSGAHGGMLLRLEGALAMLPLDLVVVKKKVQPEVVCSSHDNSQAFSQICGVR